jgi:hypothetical protein
MIKFLKDFILYPIKSKDPNNKFGQFLDILFKKYPAFLWIKPSWRKILAFPFIIIHSIFKN